MAMSGGYMAVLQGRGLRRGSILLIAPPEHPFLSEASAAGFEISLPVSDSEIEKRPGPVGGFDAAVVIDRLEKTAETGRLLEQIHAALRPQGLLLLATPSPDSWLARCPGEQWSEWQPDSQAYLGKYAIQAALLKSGFGQVWIEPEHRGLGPTSGRTETSLRAFLNTIFVLPSPLTPLPLRDPALRATSSRIMVTAVKEERRERPLCSIILPVYNERQTFPILMDQLLAKRVPGVDKEIIVVESNSHDGTREAVLRYQGHPAVRLVLQDKPRGKGNAVRAGLDQARGDVVMIQDADLEYDLDDYAPLLQPLLSYQAAFVLGARHGGDWKMRKFTDQPGLSMVANIAHVFFTTLINLLYGQRLKDPLTMFKVFWRDCLYGLEFECNRFDFDHELVIKLVRKGYRPLEVPVRYSSRSFREGKKIRPLRDPWTWLWADLKYRFVPISGRGRTP